MKFEFINPRFPDTFWGFRNVNDISGCRYAMANLALPTIAAMVPSDHQVSLSDENIEAIPYDTDADYIGFTGFNLQAPRLFELADHFREQGKKVIIGGPYASLCPEECESHADILMVGECERIFPELIQDIENGVARERYEEKDKIDLRTSPIPRWDLMNIESYGRMAIQTTRGCPFSCEFCDVIVYLGQKVRQKTPDQICAEIEALYPYLWKAGRDSIFFADDNFIGNKRYAMETCKALIELNKSFKRPLRFSTQVTINLAKNKDLLEAMTEAGFHSLFFGIESPDEAALMEANKPQNTHTDLLADIKTVQSYGIFVWAGMIVGFDTDDQSVFQKQLDFINKANIPISMTGMLNAPAHTPLWDRLQKEGRLLQETQYKDQADCNIIPKQMSTEELRTGYVQLMKELYSYENYGKRLLGSIEAIEHQPKRLKKKSSLKHVRYNISRLSRMIRYYLINGDKQRRDFFVTIVSTLMKKNRHYLKEGLWHLAAHKHFHEYVAALEKNMSSSDSVSLPSAA